MIPFSVSTVLLGFFTFLLLWTNKISDISYAFLVALSFFVGFAIYFKEHLSEIHISKMKLIFQKTKLVKEEIDKVALHLAKIIASLSTYSSGSWLNRKKLNDQIEALLSTLSVAKFEKEKILDLPRTVEKMMKDKKTLTPAEQKKIDDMFSLEEKTVEASLP